jgi:deazaflavin-dependent oxidoreductase (nitroreductase family)
MSAWRGVGWIMRVPALADRRGLRWMLNGRLGAPIVLLRHRGRRSGRAYTTPVEAIAESNGEVLVSPMRGEKGDWYRNILAGGLIEARLRGEGFTADWRRLSEQENREALATYCGAHPIYGRFIVWALARGHRLRGNALEAVAREIPVLALSRGRSAAR